jgi:hypothetical protein
MRIVHQTTENHTFLHAREAVVVRAGVGGGGAAAVLVLVLVLVLLVLALVLVAAERSGQHGVAAGRPPRPPLKEVLAAAGSARRVKTSAPSPASADRTLGAPSTTPRSSAARKALRHAVELYVPADSYTRIVVSDASRVGWAGFVAACATAELDKPVVASEEGLAKNIYYLCLAVNRIPCEAPLGVRQPENTVVAQCERERHHEAEPVSAG